MKTCLNRFFLTFSIFFSIVLSGCGPIIINGWNDTYFVPKTANNTAILKLATDNVHVMSIDRKPVILFPKLDSIKLMPGRHDIAMYFRSEPFLFPQIKKRIIITIWAEPCKIYIIRADQCDVFMETQDKIVNVDYLY